MEGTLSKYNEYDNFYLEDFNVYNSSCHDTDKNKEKLKESLVEEELVCYNENTLFRLEYIGQRPSNLDLGLGPIGCVDRITCYQMNDTWGSDHYPTVTLIDKISLGYRKKTNLLEVS
ncbi:hypothetical protein P5V15_001203 [Pogonomyrmex californicus]